MLSISLRVAMSAAVALLCAASPLTRAQTTINLHTQSGTCVAVINDSAGLTLDPTPGSTALIADSVTLSGACGSGGGSTAPTPNPIPLTAPATAVAGASFTVTWPQMTNAARCVGTGTINGVNAPSLGAWTSDDSVSTTTANSRVVSVPSSSVASTLHLTLTCWNAANSASAVGDSSNISVSPTPDGGACPTTINAPDGTRTLLTTASINYGVYPTVRPNVDLLQWDNIWGHNSTVDPVTPWPGVGGASPVIRQFPRTAYLCAHFRTTADTTRLGQYVNPSLVAGPNVTMAISTSGGDFADHLPTPGCYESNFPTSDATIMSWKLTANNPTGSCNLQPNTDYYLNLMFTQSASTVECLASATYCQIGLVNYHN